MSLKEGKGPHKVDFVCFAFADAICFTEKKIIYPMQLPFDLQMSNVVIKFEIAPVCSLLSVQIKLPSLNDTLSALRCVQIAGGSKSLFCGE